MPMPFDYNMYMSAVGIALTQHPEMRWGQVAFNVLNDMAPDFANKLRGTDCDPYYDNSKVSDFYAKVYQLAQE